MKVRQGTLKRQTPMHREHAMDHRTGGGYCAGDARTSGTRSS
jgi:hypothetical protein